MSFIEVASENGITTLTLNRGKVNAINEALIDEFREVLERCENDSEVRAIILTGQGKFFSFGFDVPLLYDLSKESFTVFLRKFTGLYTRLFTFPKPVIAALNGHTIAGGCMLATSCDYRLMVPGKVKISLNEVTFGSSVFAGSVEMLRYCVGSRNAEVILCSGSMFTADEALGLGLVDRVVAEDILYQEAKEVAREMAGRDGTAFASIKALLRAPIAAEMRAREDQSIDEFVRIWYSEKTRESLKKIQIR